MQNKSPTLLYLERLKATGRAAIKSQLKQARDYFEWHGLVEKQPFHSLSYIQIEALKQARIASGASARSINHLLCAIRAITKIAFLSGLVTEKQWLQVQSIQRLKTFPTTKGAALGADEVCELLSVYRQNKRLVPVRNTAILAMLLSTGLRRSELMALKLCHFCDEELAIEVKHGKGGKPRVQYMPQWAADDLDNWLEVRGLGSGYLFNPFLGEEPQLHRKLSATSIYNIVSRATEDLLDSRCSPHDMRRTYISQLLNENVDLLTVCKMAGHSSVTTTQIYDKRDEQNLIASGRGLSFSGGTSNRRQRR